MDLKAVYPSVALGPIYAVPRVGLSVDDLIPIVEDHGYRVVDVDRENNRLEIVKDN